jgi:glycosyltransferase involved in cell wall biosynthesis
VAFTNVKLPFFSVIIPTFNSEKTIDACIESLLSLDYPSDRLELLFIDGGSTDLTCSIIEKSGSKIKLIRTNENGPSGARNVGIKIASGDFIAFTDGDCTVSRKWISAMAKDFVTDDVAGVEGRTTSDRRGRFDQAPENLCGGHYPTCNISYRANVIRELGGFDSNFIEGKGNTRSFREDTDLAWRIIEKGYKIVFEPDAEVHHPARAVDFFTFIKRQQIWIFEALLFKKHPLRYKQEFCLIWRFSKHNIKWWFWLIAFIAFAYFAVTGNLITCLFLVAYPVFAILISVSANKNRGKILLQTVALSWALPPLSLFWTLKGSVKFKKFLL